MIECGSCGEAFANSERKEAERHALEHQPSDFYIGIMLGVVAGIGVFVVLKIIAHLSASTWLWTQ